MSARPEFLTLQEKVNSFETFLRSLKNTTLNQFEQTQIVHGILKDKTYEDTPTPWHSFIKANDMGGTFLSLINYENSVSDPANNLVFRITPITLFKFGAKMIDIINAVFESLDNERNVCFSMSPDARETVILDDIQRTIITINKLGSAISNATYDGGLLFGSIESYMQAYLFNLTEDPNDFYYSNIRDLKRNISVRIWMQCQFEAKDAFSILFKAIQDSDALDTTIAAEAASFAEVKDLHDAEVLLLQEDISQLQIEISSIEADNNTLQQNNATLAAKQEEKSVRDNFIAEKQARLIELQAEIDAIDLSSGPAALNELQKKQDEMASVNAQLADAIAANEILLTEINSIISENVSLEETVALLPEKQEVLASTQGILNEKQADFAINQNLSNAIIERLNAKKQYLPLSSSPGYAGGGLFNVLTNKISDIDGYAKPQFTNFWVIDGGYSLPTTSVSVEGMPVFSNSVAIDYGFGLALSSLGQNELCSKFNIGTQDNVSDYNYYNPVDLKFIDSCMYIHKYKNLINDLKKSLINDYMISNSIASKYEIEKEIEQFDDKKARYDLAIAEINLQIESLDISIEEDKSDEEKEKQAGNELAPEIQILTDTIDSLTVLIEEKEVSKATYQSNLAVDNASLAALDPASDTYASDLALLQDSIAEWEFKLSNVINEIAADTAAKLDAVNSRNTKLQQMTVIQENIASLQASVLAKGNQINALNAEKEPMDIFVINYDVERSNLTNNAVMGECWGILDTVNQWGDNVKSYYGSNLDAKSNIVNMIQQITAVKSTTNIRNN